MDATPQKRDNHTPSCAVCQRRKVKCDRTYPCAACSKSGLECAFNPVVGRENKRARRTVRTTTSAPRHAADDHAVRVSLETTTAYRDPSSAVSASANTPSTAGAAPTSHLPSPESIGPPATALLVSDGNSGFRYVNNHLWSALSSGSQAGSSSPATSPDDHVTAAAPPRQRSDEPPQRTPDTATATSPPRNFLFGNAHSSVPPEDAMRCPASHIVYLWHSYLANVDPIMKISHSPSVQQIVLGHIGRPTSPPPNEQALVAAIYLIGAVSLTPEQCHEHLQEPRQHLIQKFRNATETYLSAANFVTSTDISVLQALILYLSALRSIGEVQVVWSVFGLACRIAGTMGLARDGTALGLSPFETEIRRRLWWGIVYFDGRMSELVGQDGDLMGVNFDTMQPSNFNDLELFPTMKRLPESRSGPTESIYMQARTLCVTSARGLHSCTGPSGIWARLHDTALSRDEKIHLVQQIEQRLNDEIIAICDPTVPLQWLSINTVRTFASKLRLVARVPVIELDRDWEMADGYSENAFILSIDLMQLQLDLWNEPMVQHWRWHWQAHFQWYALVCLLRQTRLRRGGPGISRAWSLITKAFEIIIPSLELGPRKSLLLDGIHTLLAAAKTQNGPQGPEAMSGSAPAKFAPVPPLSASSTYHSRTGFATKYGSRPHSALLPGLDSAKMAPPDLFHRSELEYDYADSPPAFHLGGIDWVELDRLASELCMQ